MEHCPLCGRDTACTTIDRLANQTPIVIYRCSECWVEWKPNSSREWWPMEKFNIRDVKLDKSVRQY